jgi:hypothetical protein
MLCANMSLPLIFGSEGSMTIELCKAAREWAGGSQTALDVDRRSLLSRLDIQQSRVQDGLNFTQLGLWSVLRLFGRLKCCGLTGSRGRILSRWGRGLL